MTAIMISLPDVGPFHLTMALLNLIFSVSYFPCRLLYLWVCTEGVLLPLTPPVFVG